MFISIDRNSNISIKKQLYDALTYKILKKELSHGQKMPSSRQLASQLNIARNTVTEIYDQLVAEAYLVTHQGKGTYVAKLRDCSLCVSDKKCDEQTKRDETTDIISLVAGTPDLTSFPAKAWQGSYRKILNNNELDLYGYGNPNGYTPLRKSLAKYLKHHKGIYCSYKQIVITGGTKDALRLIGLSLKDSFKDIQIECPGIDFAPDVFASCGYKVLPVNVDCDGIVVDDLKNHAPSLIYSSPAHQFPIGGTLSICRRQKLIDFASKNNHIILEDDYDSEFKHKGAPVNSLYQLCSDNVIHLGTFSKTLCPSLRLGYAVIPQQILSEIKDYRYSAGNPPDTLNQAILHDLIASGAYEKHIYKMTKVYKAKMKLLAHSLGDLYQHRIEINGCALGLHISAHFRDMTFTQADKDIFKQQGLKIDYLNDYCWATKKTDCNTVILGFGHLNQSEIKEAIIRLEKAIQLIDKKE